MFRYSSETGAYIPSDEQYKLTETFRRTKTSVIDLKLVRCVHTRTNVTIHWQSECYTHY